MPLTMMWVITQVWSRSPSLALCTRCVFRYPSNCNTPWEGCQVEGTITNSSSPGGVWNTIPRCGLQGVLEYISICCFQLQQSLLFHHGNCSKRHLQHYQQCHRQICQFGTERCCTVHSHYSLGLIWVRGREWEGNICSARPFCIILISCLKWVITYDSATSTYTIGSKLDANAYASVATHIQVRCIWHFTSLT